MKTITIKSLWVLALCISIGIPCYAQFWKLGGNPAATGHGTVTVSNFLGTTANNPDDVRFGTNAVSRIFVRGTNAPLGTVGFIGIGNDFLQPKNRLHQHDNDVNLHQFTNNK